MRNHKSTVYLRANLFFMTTPSVLGTESVLDFELVFLIPPGIPIAPFAAITVLGLRYSILSRNSGEMS